MKTMTMTITIASLVLAAGAAHAAPPHFEGFEDPGFTTGGDNWNDFLGGQVQRVASGTDSITSATGSGHAIVTNLASGTDVFGNASLGANGPYTRFGGYSTDFDGGFTASIDIYLDTNWTDGMGFDYSVAANGTDGNHQRDFIWHVGVDNGNLLVNASNNTDLNYNAFKLNNENSGTNHTITTSGWYTFEQVFTDVGGALSVQFNLIDAGGNTLYSISRSNPADLIGTEVGGNRYGYFSYNNIDRLAIDNTSLIPAPGTTLALSVAGLAVTRRRRR